MKISDILNKYETTLSFEVFPPKTDDKFSVVESAVLEMTELKPDFMSVTYGAGGGANNRFTSAIAADIIEHGVNALAHLTCVCSTKELIAERLCEFEAAKIENILALRGDIPENAENIESWGYRHANELITDIAKTGKFCVGAACYPEGHVEAKSLDEDIEYMKLKADAGCSFFTTQMFFDNDKFYRFVEKVRAKGIEQPIIAGIMPIISAKQVKRSCELSGTVMPKNLAYAVERYGDRPESMRELGLAYACEQIADLVVHGVNNIHVYVMNRPETAKRIRYDLGHILPVHEC